MKRLNFQREALVFAEALKRHDITAEDLAILHQNDVAMSYIAYWLTTLTRKPTSEAREAQIQAIYDAKYPPLDPHKLSTRAYGQLVRSGVRDICHLQTLSERDLLDNIQNIGKTSVQEIQVYLYNLGKLRLRYENEPRGARVKEIIGDARILPLRYLIAASNLSRRDIYQLSELGIRRLGDCCRIRIDVLIRMKDKSGKLVFDKYTVYSINEELREYGLGFATE